MVNWITLTVIALLLAVILWMAGHISALRKRLALLKATSPGGFPAASGDASELSSTRLAPVSGEEAPLRPLLRVVEGMCEAVIHLDGDGQVRWMNQTAVKLLGWPASDSVGKSLSEVAPLKFTRSYINIDDKRFRVSQVATREGARVSVLLRRSKLADEVSGDNETLLFMRDVSHELDTLEELESARRNFREVIRKTPYSVVVLQARRMVYVNPCWASSLGYESSRALIGELIDDILLPSERTQESLAYFETIVAPSPNTTAMFKSVLESSSGAPQELREARFLRKDGDVVVMELSPVQAIRFNQSDACLVVARDVTEIKKMQTQLMIADRMVSVGTLAAGVAHEINNPLSYTIANIDFIKNEFQEAAREGRSADIEEIAEVLHEASEGAERVRVIVQDLKTFSRSTDEGRDALDVHEVMESAIKLVWNEIRHRAELVRSYADAVPPVLANESRLGQVFLNLLVNAAQAMPEGEAAAHHITLTTQVNDEGQVLVCVADNGPGIPPENLRRIFDPFFTTKPVGVGTGLGLSICHNIITALGGRLTVESVVGEGTTFQIALPVSASANAEPLIEGDEDVVNAEPVLRSRILVIDDDTHVSRALKRTLRAHQVETVNNGQEAIERCLSNDYDFILCDLMMPDITGMDVYSAVSLKRPELVGRMIFMTGGAFTARARQFLASVVNPRIDKPFDHRQIQALMREMQVAYPQPDGEAR